MSRFILPAFGDRRVDAVSAKDMRNWFDDLSVTRAGSANRALAVLSSMMKHAEALGLRPEDSNPCRGLRRRKTGFEAHYLTDDEFAALGRACESSAFTTCGIPMRRSRSTAARAFASSPGCSAMPTSRPHSGMPHLAEGSVFDAANRVSRGLAAMLDGGEADHD